MMQRMYPRMKQVLTPRWILNYTVFFAVATVLQYSYASLGSLIRRWSHLGWSQNVLTWAVALAFVLAVAEIWYRIDRRFFGPWPRSGPTAVGISLFSGLGEPARYWLAFVVAGVSAAALTLTGSAYVFLLTFFGIAFVVDIVSLSFEYYHRRKGVAG
jgi:hypothetical protein